MWSVSDEFKRLSTTNHIEPFYNNILYDDVFLFEVSGTQNIYKYDSDNNKVFCTYGTPTYSGMDYVQIEQGTGVRLGTGGTIGSWVSPIMTPFYNASWYLMVQDDSTIAKSLCDNFDAIRWTNLDWLTKVDVSIEAQDYDFIYYGSQGEANRIKIVNYGNQITQVSINDLMVDGTSWYDYGEVTCSCQVDDNFAPSTLQIFQLKNDDSLYTTGLRYAIEGTHMIAEAYFLRSAGASGALRLGTIGTGINYFYKLNWNTNVADKIVLTGWIESIQGGSLVGTYKEGTFTKTDSGLVYSNFYIGQLNTTIGTARGTYWLGNFAYNGTQVSQGSNYDGIVSKVAGQYDYYIRTSDDGTTFNDWVSITGTRQTNTDSRCTKSLDMLYIGTNVQKSRYAQAMGVFSTILGTGTRGRPRMRSLQVNSRLDVDSNYILESGDVSNTIESDFKMGNFIADRYNFTLINTPSTYLNKPKIIGEKY